MDLSASYSMLLSIKPTSQLAVVVAVVLAWRRLARPTIYQKNHHILALLRHLNRGVNGLRLEILMILDHHHHIIIITITAAVEDPPKHLREREVEAEVGAVVAGDEIEDALEVDDHDRGAIATLRRLRRACRLSRDVLEVGRV